MRVQTYTPGILVGLMDQPVQFIALKSGSHSPFPIHIDILGPLSIIQGGQLKSTLLSITAGSMKPKILT